MLTKGGGNGEMGLFARAAPVNCTYVSWMSFSSISVICVCINSVLLDILCSLHCTASVCHVSDELTIPSCFAIMFYLCTREETCNMHSMLT